MKAGRKQEYPEKTPGDELQKIPHTSSLVDWWKRADRQVTPCLVKGGTVRKYSRTHNIAVDTRMS